MQFHSLITRLDLRILQMQVMPPFQAMEPPQIQCKIAQMRPNLQQILVVNQMLLNQVLNHLQTAQIRLLQTQPHQPVKILQLHLQHLQIHQILPHQPLLKTINQLELHQM